LGLLEFLNGLIEVEFEFGRIREFRDNEMIVGIKPGRKG
jgi:hypothetical protein